MNDTKDIQTIRAVIGLNIDPCETDHKVVDIIHEAEFALSRLEARLSAHQEVISALEGMLSPFSIHENSFEIQAARDALARAKEGQ